MKTVMIIDGADNCAYDCFLMTDQLFAVVFPGKGQDIEFIEDVRRRVNIDDHEDEFKAMWGRPVPKRQIRGLDGMLFYELERKKKFYPNKRDSDLDHTGRSFSVREIEGD